MAAALLSSVQLSTYLARLCLRSPPSPSITRDFHQRLSTYQCHFWNKLVASWTEITNHWPVLWIGITTMIQPPNPSRIYGGLGFEPLGHCWNINIDFVSSYHSISVATQCHFWNQLFESKLGPSDGQLIKDLGGLDPLEGHRRNTRILFRHIIQYQSKSGTENGGYPNTSNTPFSPSAYANQNTPLPSNMSGGVRQNDEEEKHGGKNNRRKNSSRKNGKNEKRKKKQQPQEEEKRPTKRRRRRTRLTDRREIRRRQGKEDREKRRNEGNKEEKNYSASHRIAGKGTSRPITFNSIRLWESRWGTWAGCVAGSLCGLKLK